MQGLENDGQSRPPGSVLNLPARLLPRQGAGDAPEEVNGARTTRAAPPPALPGAAPTRAPAWPERPDTLNPFLHGIRATAQPRAPPRSRTSPDRAVMAIEGFLALIRDQVMGKQPRMARPKASVEEGSLELLDPALIKHICLQLDFTSICRMQTVCRHLFEAISSNGLWCVLCERRQIRLEAVAPDPNINWKYIFACFAPLQVRRFGWTFKHPEELLKVAGQVKQMGPHRTDPLTVLRKRIPATEFWQWWFVTTRGAGAAGGGGRGAGLGSSHGAAAGGGILKQAGRSRAGGSAKRAGSDAKKADKEAKPRRRLVLRTSTRSITRGMPDLPPLAPLAASSNKRHSPRVGARESSRESMRGMPGGLGVPRSPIIMSKPQPRPSRAAAAVPQYALSPAKMPPRLPPRAGGPPARPADSCQYSPFDYVSKQQLEMHIRALVAEASNSGVRVQQLRTLLRQLMKVRPAPQPHSPVSNSARGQPQRVCADHRSH